MRFVSARSLELALARPERGLPSTTLFSVRVHWVAARYTASPAPMVPEPRIQSRQFHIALSMSFIALSKRCAVC